MFGLTFIFLTMTRKLDAWDQVNNKAPKSRVHIKDERLVIGIGNNRDLDRLLRLRSITISA